MQSMGFQSECVSKQSGIYLIRSVPMKTEGKRKVNDHGKL